MFNWVERVLVSGLVGFWVGRFGVRVFRYRNRWALVRLGFNGFREIGRAHV